MFVTLHLIWIPSRGQDYKEKLKTRLKTNVKRTVLNNTKLRHFWAQIVSWAPIHARKTFIILAQVSTSVNEKAEQSGRKNGRWYFSTDGVTTVGGVTAGQARHKSINVGGVTVSQVRHNSSYVKKHWNRLCGCVLCLEWCSEEVRVQIISEALRDMCRMKWQEMNKMRSICDGTNVSR